VTQISPDTEGVTLVVVAGRATGTRLPIGAEPVVLGRAAEGPGALDGDPECSRNHARIQSVDGEPVIEDLGSANGTYVNGNRISGPTPLKPGDSIWVGMTTLLVTAPNVAPPDVLPAAAPAPTLQTGFLNGLATLPSRRPKRVLALVGLLFVVAIVLGAPVGGHLHAQDAFRAQSSESVKVDHAVGAATGEEAGPQLLALIRTGQDVDSPATRAKVQAVADEIKRGTGVTRVLTYYDTHSPAQLSRDGKATYVAAYFKDGREEDIQDSAEAIQEKITSKPEVIVGGPAIAGRQTGKQVGMDLGKAEGMAFPLLFLLSLFVFRGFVAALMPLFVGALTVFTTFFALRLINGVVEMSVFALNIVIALGLGLAIDYSLFIVSRYREELARGGTQSEALRRTVYTAGRTVLFSSITVAIALATLTIFPQPFLYSMGIGGAVCALIAATMALVALPSLLAVIGPRINAGAPKRWKAAAQQTARGEESGPWYRLAQGVMRRPLPVAVAATALLILMGLPALGIKFTGIDTTALPTTLSSRVVDDAIKADFPANAATAARVLVKAPPSAGTQVTDLQRQLRLLPGAITGGPPAQPLKGNLWLAQVQIRGGPLAKDSKDLVKTIRARNWAFPVTVAGETAAFLDQSRTVSDRLPIVVAALCLLTAFVLFLMTGSVVIPLKSLVMNFLSLFAAFGLLVLIFQKGNLEGPLGYTSQGAIELSQPVLLFAIAFGLSTDYAVFLLTRIAEARARGASNRDAVAIGLERTGRIVTQAAVLFCVAIGAFATSKVIFIKEVGIGTALAVIIDATIVRAFLVPSLMAMLGERNWWAPKPLRRLHAKIGLKEE
jgi:RND superfamily putative drug exporter